MTAFGLDMSDAWIRLAMLEKRRSAWRWPIRGEIAVPKDYIVDGEIRQPQQVSTLIKKLVKAAGLRSRQTYVSLPERHTFIKLITLPDDHASAIAQAVGDEAVHHLPYTIDEVYFDWLVVPEKNSHGQTQVVIGAAPKTLVDTYLSVVGNADLEVVGLDIESLAIARAVIPPEAKKETSLILDLGRSRSTLILLKNAVVQFSATIRYAGKELNQYITDELHITDEQAERAKQIFGLDPNRGKGLLRKVLSPQIDNLVNKIQEVEQFYLEHFIDHQPIERILLTGSGAMMRGIDRELSKRLHLPVTLQLAWVYEQVMAKQPDQRADIGYTYATALGLALTRFAA